MTPSSKRIAHALRPFLDDPRSFELPLNGAPARWLISQGLGHSGSKLLKIDRPTAFLARIILLSELEAKDFSLLDAMPDNRSASLRSTNNEKFHRTAPRAARVAIKSFPGKPLLDGEKLVHLDPSDNFEIDCDSILRFSSHEAVVAVENWETFERLPDPRSSLCSILPAGCNPLAIWRGSPDHPVQAALSAIKLLGKPCYAYVDFDPSGLLIARALPHFIDLLAPPASELEPLFHEFGRSKLYVDQIKTMPPRDANAPAHWKMVFDLCIKFSAGLPQEHFS